MAKATHQCQLCMRVWLDFLFQVLLSPAVRCHESKICEFDPELQGYALLCFLRLVCSKRLGFPY